MSTVGTHNRKTSGTTSSLAKRQASENFIGKSMALPPHMAKKRPALANVTNQRTASHNVPRNAYNSMVPHVSKISDQKKGSSTTNNSSGSICSSSVHVKPTAAIKSTLVAIKDATARCKMDVSPSKSDGLSVSMDETMSTCDSLNSPDVEYIDRNDIAAIDSIERKTCSKLNISDNVETAGMCKREILMEMGTNGKIVDLDVNFMDPQLCATMACDIYQHLRASEAKKRPSIDFVETIKKEISLSRY